MQKNQLEWISETHLKIDNVEFFVTFDPDEYLANDPNEDRFIIIKAKPLIEFIQQFGQENDVQKILELGVFKGGSVVLHDKLFSPLRNVAIEYTPQPVEALDKYIKRSQRDEQVKLYYGVDQADSRIVREILSSEFPDRDIDLIIDDASHMYDKTRSSFNTCFPYLKAGGHFIIEDWGWAHWQGDFWQKRPWQIWKWNAYNYKKALSNILIELFMLTASRPDFISEIKVDKNNIIVTKGQGETLEEHFDIGDYYLLRGKNFKPHL